MIFGEHDFGWSQKFTVAAGDRNTGQGLVVVRTKACHESGLEIHVESHLDRTDLERLRDLCNEALS